MEKDLRMEVFASKDTVKPISLHEYKLISKKIDNNFSIIRGAVRKLKRYNQVGIFENGYKIYSTDILDKSIQDVDFTIKYEGLKELPVLENRKIYCDLIKYLINQNLCKVSIMNKYRKYSCKSSITSKWIMTDDGFSTFKSNNKEIELERKYNLNVDILDEGKAYLWIDTSSIFTSKLSVYDYMQRGINPVGMEVKNDWSNDNQTGTLVEICNFTVIDKLENTFTDGSLKDYYIGINQGYRVENIPDNTNVVKMKFGAGGVYNYYPQALKPILTREKVLQIDAQFSQNIDKYIKRDMNTRLKLDKDFVKDIGILKPLNNLEFDTKTCNVESMGYKKGTVPLPKLICGKNKSIDCKNKFQVFNYGFYRKPDKNIKIGYIYPKNNYEKMRAVVNEIYSFAKNGKYQGEADKYILEGLLDIQSTAMIKEEYSIGDITDYKRAANKLQRVEGIDIVIALVPNGKEDDDNPYNPFKSVWANANIPSQMISLETAELFQRGKAEGNKTKYYLQNIVLGILGKVGGIPWIIEDMPGNVDCFVGLDVATVKKGIHYPACSVSFDKYGRLLGFYKPLTPQQGEKITEKILQDIFDNVILSYEEHFGKILKNIVIHRDGFSNENNDWYRDYFEAKNIEYSIIEVRKNISKKLIYIQNNNICNPDIGHCVYNDNIGYLVTTDIIGKKGSPNPILIEKKCGNISMTNILKQVMNLSQLHVGSTHKMRLPITTGYADKICKNREFVPEGKISNKLFFL